MLRGNFFNKLSLRHKGGYNYIETESTLSIGQNIHDIGVLLAITKFFLAKAAGIQAE